MATQASTIVAFASVAVSGALGLASVWLALRKRNDEDALARAVRRTTALQLLSDEEFALIRVRDECVALQSLIDSAGGKLGADHGHLAGEARRIVGESEALLTQVREKRRRIEPQIQSLPAVEIEAVIAAAYQGMKLAEAQLQRTLLSKSDTVRCYGL